MSSQPCRDRTEFETVRSRLSEALLRLQNGIEQSRRDEARVETMFHTWQKQWSGRRELIAHRLEMIERQLERLTPKEGGDSQPPQLVVFGVPHDSDEMTSMTVY
jgi:hypothetical protein